MNKMVTAFLAASAVVGCSHAQNLLIYSNDFEVGAGPEWSNMKKALTPVGYRHFLGRFGSGITNVLTMTNLPPHTNVTILCDVFAIQSWDGSGDGCCGPDIWDVREVGSATPMFRTSFSDNGNHQAYPDTRPNGDNVAFSGAWELRTLGYTFPYNGGPPVPSDSVYQMSLNLTHSASSLAVQFYASLGSSADEETWGLDNVSVYVGAAPSIRVTSLTNHQSFSAPADILIAADVQTNNDPLQAVEFYANRTSLGTRTNAPFSVQWTNVAAGMYTIRVRARAVSGLWSDALVPISVNGLRGEYFNNLNLSGPPVTRVDPRINFTWTNYNPPIPGVGGGFSARWTGFIVPNYSETYRFSTTNDDGIRLWIDNQQLINAWYDQVGSHTNQIQLTAGRAYPIRLEYYNSQCCGATIQLFWESPSQPRQIIQQGELFPPCSFPPQLLLQPIGGGQAALEWATNSCGFQLVSADTLSSADWITNFPLVSSATTNGRNKVLVNLTNAQGFFRLQR